MLTRSRKLAKGTLLLLALVVVVILPAQTFWHYDVEARWFGAPSLHWGEARVRIIFTITDMKNRKPVQGVTLRAQTGILDDWNGELLWSDVLQLKADGKGIVEFNRVFTSSWYESALVRTKTNFSLARNWPDWQIVVEAAGYHTSKTKFISHANAVEFTGEEGTLRIPIRLEPK